MPRDERKIGPELVVPTLGLREMDLTRAPAPRTVPFFVVFERELSPEGTVDLRNLMRMLLGLSALALLAACDHKGKSSDVGGTLAGIWVNDGAYDEYVRRLGTKRDFCEFIEARSHAYRAFDEDSPDHPRLLEVTPDGQVVRWSPRGEVREERVRRTPIVGIDRLRLLNLNQMVRRGTNGDETFVRTTERTATHFYHEMNRCLHADSNRRAWGE